MENIDIEGVINRRKTQWAKEAVKQLSIQERIAASVPWWLIIIGAGLFALSASHTAGVFSELSPVGYAGPFVVEFALLWAAFARVTNTKISGALKWLERLAFVMAVVANGIGAISRVTELAGIDKFSMAVLIDKIGTLPVKAQADIIFVPMFALFIPIGTWVVGEGLASLVIKSRQSGSALEERWRVVEQEQIRQALYLEFIHHMTSQEARVHADAVSAHLTGGQRTDRRPRVSATDKVAALPDGVKVSAADVHEASAPRSGRNVDAQKVVRDYLSAHPEIVNEISVRQLASATGVSKSLAGEILKEWKESR